MKVFSLAIVLTPPGKSATVLCSASDLSSFSFYQRGSIAEFMKFFTTTVAERTQQGQRQSIQEGSHTAHVYNRGGAEQLAGSSLLSLHVFTTSAPTAGRSSGDDCGRRIPCAAGIFAPDQDARRLHRQGSSSIVQYTGRDFLPGA